jgi:hypothetical protein
MARRKTRARCVIERSALHRNLYFTALRRIGGNAALRAMRLFTIPGEIPEMEINEG